MGEANTDLRVSNAIEGFLAEQLPREVLLRHMLSLGAWLVPVDRVDGEATVRTRAGVDGGPNQVVAYSDPSLMEAARASGAADDLGGDWVTLNGRTLVGVVGDIGGLLVNPHTERALVFSPGQMSEFVQVGNVMGVERALADATAPPIPPAALQAIANFERFEVIVRGPQTLDLAPDDKGRKLLAAFTCPLARDQYLTQMNSLTFKHGLARVLPLTGVELAHKLLSLDILGVVFNCAGPMAPCALHRQLGQHILDAVAEE